MSLCPFAIPGMMQQEVASCITCLFAYLFVVFLHSIPCPYTTPAPVMVLTLNQTSTPGHFIKIN